MTPLYFYNFNSRLSLKKSSFHESSFAVSKEFIPNAYFQPTPSLSDEVITFVIAEKQKSVTHLFHHEDFAADMGLGEIQLA